jgi:hypothetical protein
MVQHCLDALTFEAGLGEAWVGVSLEWALHARNRHLACRSQQVRNGYEGVLHACLALCPLKRQGDGCCDARNSLDF